MKNYWAFILLAFLAGFIGLQEFYVGRPGRGILSILFCWTAIPGIIAFIQGCCWLFNGEEQFNAKFNA